MSCILDDCVHPPAGGSLWMLPKEHWPAEAPADWLEWVNAPASLTEEEALPRCIKRGVPLGERDWVRRTAKRLALGSSLRPTHRPRKKRQAAPREA